MVAYWHQNHSLLLGLSCPGTKLSLKVKKIELAPMYTLRHQSKSTKCEIFGCLLNSPILPLYLSIVYHDADYNNEYNNYNTYNIMTGIAQLKAFS